MSTSYADPVEIAKRVRANIRSAQKAGKLATDLTIRVRIRRASMCTEINVYITGDKLTNDYLVRPENERREHGCWTPAALELAATVHPLMDEAEQWSDGRMRFACLYFRDGLCAP